jgi:hypothetical protein
MNADDQTLRRHEVAVRRESVSVGCTVTKKGINEKDLQKATKDTKKSGC